MVFSTSFTDSQLTAVVVLEIGLLKEFVVAVCYCCCCLYAHRDKHTDWI